MTTEEQTRIVEQAIDILKERDFSFRIVATEHLPNKLNSGTHLWVPLYSPSIDYIFSDEFKRMKQALREGVHFSYEERFRYQEAQINRLNTALSELLSDKAEQQEGGAV